MKRMLLLLSLVILLLGPKMSQALSDDIMGLYFDQGELVNCQNSWNVEPFSTFPLYLMLVNPTFPELYGFEAGLTIDGPAMLFSAVVENDNSIDIGIPGNHMVGFAEPTVMMQSNLLITFTIVYTSSTMEDVCFKLHGSSPSSINPLYPTILVSENDMRMVGVETGYQDCSAIISDWYCNVTATEETTWDSLKTLYR